MTLQSRFLCSSIWFCLAPMLCNSDRRTWRRTLKALVSSPVLGGLGCTHRVLWIQSSLADRCRIAQRTGGPYLLAVVGGRSLTVDRYGAPVRRDDSMTSANDPSPARPERQ